MNLALRIVLYLLLAGALLFCVSGFTATFEPIEPAVRMTMRVLYGLGAMLAAHPRGLDLPISEGGRGLSGGQRMLASLARLLVLDPDVWLLDEPTANLDQLSEARILAEISRRITPQRTLVFATHRPRNLALSTRVIVLNEGKVALDGPTEDILKKLAEQAQSARLGGGTVP